jgi:hypothetical protein
VVPTAAPAVHHPNRVLLVRRRSKGLRGRRIKDPVAARTCRRRITPPGVRPRRTNTTALIRDSVAHRRRTATTGGWNGAPPPGGWNRHWDGPDRDIDQGRFDHQPFQYYGYQAVPIWAPDMGGWGFWFFGVWIPL